MAVFHTLRSGNHTFYPGNDTSGSASIQMFRYLWLLERPDSPKETKKSHLLLKTSFPHRRRHFNGVRVASTLSDASAKHLRKHEIMGKERKVEALSVWRRNDVRRRRRLKQISILVSHQSEANRWGALETTKPGDGGCEGTFQGDKGDLFDVSKALRSKETLDKSSMLRPSRDQFSG